MRKVVSADRLAFLILDSIVPEITLFLATLLHRTHKDFAIQRQIYVTAFPLATLLIVATVALYSIFDSQGETPPKSLQRKCVCKLGGSISLCSLRPEFW